MKTKPVIIIIASIIIGFLIGFVTNGFITKSRIEKFVRSGTHEGFKGKYYRVIDPDEEQRKAIDPILDKYGEMIHENVVNMQKSMKDLHDAMLMEIEPYLNEDQQSRLEESVRRFERDENFRSGRRRPPPPGHHEGDRKKRYDQQPQE